MSKNTERLRNHVASYKSLSRHRQNCLDVCAEVEHLTAAAEQFEERCLWAEEDNERLTAEVQSAFFAGCDYGSKYAGDQYLGTPERQYGFDQWKGIKLKVIEQEEI